MKDVMLKAVCICMFPPSVLGLMADATVSESTSVSMGIMLAAVGLAISGTTAVVTYLVLDRLDRKQTRKRLEICELALGIDAASVARMKRHKPPGIPGEE